MRERDLETGHMRSFMYFDCSMENHVYQCIRGGETHERSWKIGFYLLIEEKRKLRKSYPCDQACSTLI